MRAAASKTKRVEKTPPKRPTGAVRLAFRLPVYLYRLRLGWLLGRRFLLLVHRGRKSGLLRRTALEVVRHDPDTNESIVVSGWGAKSDWYKNIRASRAVEVRTGGRSFAPKQRFLTPEEVYREIETYERRNPRLIKGLSGWLGHPVDGSEEARREFADSLRMVAFSPES